jgi:hypothetical protein
MLRRNFQVALQLPAYQDLATVFGLLLFAQICWL